MILDGSIWLFADSSFNKLVDLYPRIELRTASLVLAARLSSLGAPEQ